MSNEFLRGKIIRILDDQRLIINVGLQHGVQIGDRFYIYESGEEIIDPESGESLGQMELVKAEVEVIHVQEKIAFVIPPQKEQKSPQTVLSATLQQISPSGRIGVDSSRDHLNVRQDQISSPIQSGPITVGDSVRGTKPKS